MPLVAKDPKVGELRGQADALRAQLADTANPLTFEQVSALTKDIQALEMRAQALAGFTPDAEIARQGGDEPLTRIAPNADTPEVRGTKAKVMALRGAIQREFGGTAAYLRAIYANRADTPAQAQVLRQAEALTRAIIGTASDASGGEFLLPLEQEPSIFAADNMQAGLLERARRYTMSGRTKRIPHLKQTNGDITRPLSSIAAVSIVGEGTTIGTREPVFAQRLLTAYKYAAITQVGAETVEDDFTGDLEPTLAMAVGGEVLNQANFDVTIAGTGSSQPTGALHTSANAALVKVTRTTANRIKFADAVNMYTRHTHGPRSFWMISRRAFGELFTFEVSEGSGATFLANLLSDPSKVPLLGYPIVVSDFLNALGSEGDFALVNPDFYAVGMRSQLTVARSEHVGFTSDLETWKFAARIGGIPIPDGTYAYRSVSSSKVNEHSPFVVLDDVVTS